MSPQCTCTYVQWGPLAFGFWPQALQLSPPQESESSDEAHDLGWGGVGWGGKCRGYVYTSGPQDHLFTVSCSFESQLLGHVGSTMARTQDSCHLSLSLSLPPPPQLPSLPTRRPSPTSKNSICSIWSWTQSLWKSSPPTAPQNPGPAGRSPSLPDPSESQPWGSSSTEPDGHRWQWLMSYSPACEWPG